MNMMEFVKLFRRMDTLDRNNEMICDAIRKLAKNQKALAFTGIVLSMDLLLVWLYTDKQDKKIKDLEDRLEALETKDLYESCDCEDYNN